MRYLVHHSQPMSLSAFLEYPVRVVSFTVNDQGATGLLAFWARHLRSIHTIYSEERSSASYETYTSAHGVWIYFPLDDGEFVTKLCRRPFPAASSSSTLLVRSALRNFSHTNSKKPNCIASSSRTKGESSSSDLNHVAASIRHLLLRAQNRWTNVL